MELSGSFLFGLSYGGKLYLVLGDIEYGSDNLLNVIEDRENLLHDAVMTVFLGIMLDVVESLSFKAAYADNVGKHKGRELCYNF